MLLLAYQFYEVSPMCAVVRKNKTSMLGRVIGKLRTVISPGEQRFISPDVPLDDTRSDDDSAAAIEARRDELRGAKHDSSDVTVFVEGGN
jgi:hypothetical protein